MADATTSSRPKARPGENMRLIEAVQYRLPPAGWVSILHRASGILLFALLPFLVWMFDQSVTALSTYDQFVNVFRRGVWVLPGWLIKLICLALIWAYLHHFIAGVRHVWMDATHSVSKEQGRLTALATLVLSLASTAVLAGKVFGLY